MASSLISGLVASGYDPKSIWASNPSPAKLESLKQHLPIQTTQDNHHAVSLADIVVLAVKPQKLQAVANELAQSLTSKLIISVAAGVSTTQLQTWLGNHNLSVIRCMPNTPAHLRAGVTGLYADKTVSQTQKDAAAFIMQSVGTVLWVEKEEEIDIVAALSGSGPAYFFRVMEALQAGAEKLGLPSKQANMLTLQTALGAAKMAVASTESLKALREHVTSPGGMTEKAIGVLEAGEINRLFYDALCAGQKRAQEMAEQLKDK